MEDIFWRSRCSVLNFPMQLAFQVNSTGWGRTSAAECGTQLRSTSSPPAPRALALAGAVQQAGCCASLPEGLLHTAQPSCSLGPMESWNKYHVVESQVSRSQSPECSEGSKRAFKGKINKNNVYKVHGGAWRWKLQFFDHGRGWPTPRDWAACLKWELRQKFNSFEDLYTWWLAKHMIEQNTSIPFFWKWL